MGETLTEFLKDRKFKGFESRPIYSADGDFISIYLSDEDSYAERIDDLLTVYHSVKTDALVGCKIKGVRRLLKTLGDFGVSVQNEDISVSLLFVAATLSSPEQRDRYRQLGLQSRNLRIPKKTLALIHD